jgi:2-oxoglutarate ferredoxin oxidoreductase subunit gamma
MRLTEIRFAGFGGQGVILAASVVGKAATLHQNLYATMCQNFGPESRGGACSAQLLISTDPILYPYVTQTDILAVMSQEAYFKFAGELKPNGLMIVEEDLVRISDLPAETRVYGIPATRLAEEIGKKVVLNMVMVGAFTAITKLLEPDSVRRAVADSVPGHLRDVNLRAFDAGFNYTLTCHSEGELADAALVVE